MKFPQIVCSSSPKSFDPQGSHASKVEACVEEQMKRDQATPSLSGNIWFGDMVDGKGFHENEKSFMQKCRFYGEVVENMKFPQIVCSSSPKSFDPQGSHASKVEACVEEQMKRDQATPSLSGNIWFGDMVDGKGFHENEKSFTQKCRFYGEVVEKMIARDPVLGGSGKTRAVERWATNLGSIANGQENFVRTFSFYRGDKSIVEKAPEDLAFLRGMMVAGGPYAIGAALGHFPVAPVVVGGAALVWLRNQALEREKRAQKSLDGLDSCARGFLLSQYRRLSSK